MDEKIKDKDKKRIFNPKELFFKYLKSYITIEKDSMGRVADIALDRLRYAASGVAFGLVSFFFSSAMGAMGTYPFGIALLSAAVKYLPFCYLGAAAASLFVRGYSTQLFAVFTIIFLVRIFISRVLCDRGKIDRFFAEPFPIRLAVGTAAGALCGIWNTFRFGFLYYDIFGLVFLLTAVPLCVWLFSWYFEIPNVSLHKAEAGLAALAAVLIFSLRSISLFGISAATVCAFALTVYTAAMRGALYGGVFGIIGGLAALPMHAPAFALAGMGYGLLRRASSAVPSAVACLVGIVCGFYTDGFVGLRQLAPPMLITSMLTAPLAQFNLLPPYPLRYADASADDKMSDMADRALISQKQSDYTIEHINEISQALGSLSEVFYGLSERVRKPGFFRAKQLASSVCDRVCSDCELNPVCWGRDYSKTAEMVDGLSKKIADGGTVCTKNAPDLMQKRCIKLDKILDEINKGSARLIEDAMLSDKTAVSAMDYGMMAKLLCESIIENQGEYQKDFELTKKVRQAAGYMGLGANNIVVYGNRRKTVIAGGVDLGKFSFTADALCEGFGNVCGVHFNQPQFSLDDEYVTMTLTSRRGYTLDVASAMGTAAAERMSGDFAVNFEGRDDFGYTLISDGMGSGREAALTSRLCGIFLKKMLSSGNSIKISVEMLSNFLRIKSGECFATLDLMGIDLITGEAVFIKSGAAPTFILRNGSVFKIDAKTLPIGITQEIAAEQISFALEEGDVVVMLSDGIAQDFDDGVWIVKMLSEQWAGDTSAFADMILRRAERERKRADDATVSVVKVCRV